MPDDRCGNVDQEPGVPPQAANSKCGIRGFRFTLLQLITPIILLGGCASACNNIYYDELYSVQRAFRDLPGVVVVETGGNEDVTFEDVWARLDIGGKHTMMIGQLCEDSFRSAKMLPVMELDGIRFRTEAWGHHGVVQTATGKPVRSRSIGIAIDVAPEGDCHHLMSPPPQNVRELVDRVEELVAAVKKLPRCPKYLSVTASSGNQTRISTVTHDNDTCYPPAIEAAVQ